MKQLLQIIQELNFSDSEKQRIESFFQAQSNKQLLYPRRISSKLKIDPKKICDLLFSMTIEGYLQHVTVPKIKGTDEILEGSLVEGIIGEFSTDDKFNDQDYNELTGVDVEPIAAFRKRVS